MDRPAVGADGAADEDGAAGWLSFEREARIFATRRELVERLRGSHRKLSLVADELVHPVPPCDLVVRRGNLRLSELLPDGREVTRAILQAGAVCRVRTGRRDGPAVTHGEAAESPLYSLASTVLMALGESDLWLLPAGSFDRDAPADGR